MHVTGPVAQFCWVIALWEEIGRDEVLEDHLGAEVVEASIADAQR